MCGPGTPPFLRLRHTHTSFCPVLASASCPPPEFSYLSIDTQMLMLQLLARMALSKSGLPPPATGCVLLKRKKQRARSKGVNLKVRWRAKVAMRSHSEESARRAILVWETFFQRPGKFRWKMLRGNSSVCGGILPGLFPQS